MRSNQRMITESNTSYHEIISSSNYSPRIRSHKEKVFLPFVQERDSVGRLVGKAIIERRKYRFGYERSAEKSSATKKSLLAKMFNDSQLRLTHIETEPCDINNSGMKASSPSPIIMSPIKFLTAREFKVFITSDKEVINESDTNRAKSTRNFEKVNHSKLLCINREKRKFKNQGSQLKLLSPRTVINGSPPIGLYSVESSKEFISKKNPICYIKPKREQQVIKSHNEDKRDIFPELNLKGFMVKHMKTSSESDIDFSKYSFSKRKQNPNYIPLKEATMAKIPFNFIKLEPKTSDLMRFNQIMTSKFEDTRSRLHDLKMKINEFTLNGNRYKDN